MQKYFQRFPTLYYNNMLCKDITRRVKLNPETRKNIDVFYPVEIQAGFRSDQLAEAYYEDAEMDWMIYLANEIVDPYYGWYMDEHNFNEFILKKYGTIGHAQRKIKYFRNNWYADPNEISPTYYENTLPYLARKYYDPVYGPKSKILSYKRKEVDWTTNTNKILQFNIHLETGEQFSPEEFIDIKYSGEVVGTGEVIAANSTALIVHHVTGNTSANTSAPKTIVGVTSSANGTATEVLTLQENFTNAEARFWANVSYYDWELEKNEAKKHIEVIDSGMTFDIAEQIRRELAK